MNGVIRLKQSRDYVPTNGTNTALGARPTPSTGIPVQPLRDYQIHRGAACSGQSTDDRSLSRFRHRRPRRHHHHRYHRPRHHHHRYHRPRRPHRLSRPTT